MLKPVEWLADTLGAVRDFPPPVRREIGRALTVAQTGGKHPAAKPLKGFGGAGVLEIVEDFDTDTYRAIYTVKLAGVVYVLHAFQKKAKRRIATPKRELDLVRSRLKLAREHYKRQYGKGRQRQ